MNKERKKTIQVFSREVLNLEIGSPKGENIASNVEMCTISRFTKGMARKADVFLELAYDRLILSPFLHYIHPEELGLQYDAASLSPRYVTIICCLSTRPKAKIYSFKHRSQLLINSSLRSTQSRLG